MNEKRDQIDEEALEMLEDRMRRGIPKWEQAAFIEQVVPMLIARLQGYLKFEPQS